MTGDTPIERTPDDSEDDGICKGCDGTGEHHGQLCKGCGGKGYM